MIVKLTLIIVFLVLSALTSGCEVAFFSLDKFNLRDQNSNRLIKKIEALLEKPKRLLATILISNNFINITIVILFASIDNPFLSSINNPIIETIIEVGIIGMMILFVGDILTSDSIWVMRPGGGDYLPADYAQLMGKRVKRNVKKGVQLRTLDIE